MKYGHLCALFVFGLVGTQLSKTACMLNFESFWSRMWWSKRSNAFPKTAKKNVIAQPLSKFYAWRWGGQFPVLHGVTKSSFFAETFLFVVRTEDHALVLKLTQSPKNHVRKQLRKVLRKPNPFNRPSKRTNPQTVTWLEKLTAYTKSSKKRLLQKKFSRTRHNRTLHFAYAMTNLKIYLSSCARSLSRATRGQLLSS